MIAVNFKKITLSTHSLASLPLFPLSAVLFPGGDMTLRVFEVRYLDMINRCHSVGAPFGVVALSQGAEVRVAGASPEQFHSVGTLATIQSLHTVQSGLLLITCKGAQRFRITEQRLLPHGLWLGDVTRIDDDQSVAIPTDLQSAANALKRLLASLQERAENKTPPTASELDDCAWVANRWCELLPLPVTLKQQLMALENPLLRLELINDVLTKQHII